MKFPLIVGPRYAGRPVTGRPDSDRPVTDRPDSGPSVTGRPTAGRPDTGHQNKTSNTIQAADNSSFCPCDFHLVRGPNSHVYFVFVCNGGQRCFEL